ncbi:MAG TPA: hypothetical protein VLZ89_03700 [Anaerolineales bacterium]|nr:hypothetical protein [Anaerolineales bacterium]
MNEPQEQSRSISVDPSRRSAQPSRLRVRVGLLTTLFGLFVFLVGAKPAWFGLQRSPTVGFVKISVFLVGLAIICLGGYTSLWGLWKGVERSIAADIGLRLVATGYVIAVFSGMADVFGMGSQTAPLIPFFGPIQALGVLLGEIVIAVGFLLLIPYRSYLR